MSEIESTASAAAQPTSVLPHVYPAWLVGFAAVIGVAVVYSLMVLPKYYTAVALVDKAEDADAKQQYQQAIELLRQADKMVPNSKKICLQMAYEYFELPTEADHTEAMALLSYWTLNADDMEYLQRVMPDEYRSQFQEVVK